MKDYHVFSGPFIKSKNKTSHMMRHLLIALFPIIIFSVYKNGVIPYQHGKVGILGLIYPLIFILLSSTITYLLEYISAYFFLKKDKQEIKEYLKNSYALFPGLFLGLILPINTPIPILVFGCIMATVIGKLIYGGFGNNIFNPALVGRLFVITTYSATIASAGGYFNAYELDTISKATPLSNLALVDGIGTYETVVAPYGNLFDFLIGTIPGALGETSALLCILGFIYLTLTKVIKWRIPVFYIGTVFVITWLIGILNNVGIWYPLFEILSGGLFFGAVFMATDPVTSPITKKGQVIYGICLGILTVVFRYLTPLPEGVLTSILTMNILVFLIDKLGVFLDKKKNMIIPVFIIFALLATLIGYGISSKFTSNNQETDPNFEILEVKEQGNIVTYIATQKGNGGPIKAEVKLEKNKIISLKIISHQETPSYYKLVEQEKYIEKLIQNQNKISEIDTVSGATVTSTAMKKLVINVLEDYGEQYEG